MTSETATHQLSLPKRFGSEGTANPGLVLLWAPDFAQMPAAVPLGSSALAIGREPPPGGLKIGGTAVSRLHARIHRRGDEWVLTDLDSRNGTLVDGVRVKEIVLEDLDEIRFGDALFKFVGSEIETYLPYRIDGSIAPGAPRPARIHELVGGAQMNRLAIALEAIATADLNALVLGETGTGKEVAAHAIHRASGRPGKLAAVNCAAIPTHLLESELFGYKRGAFSGADRDKMGLVRAAHGGTLLLDEIGDMALDAQAKLLRMIETREVLPLGATAAEKVDVRLVSATHRDLEKLVDEGKFRGDLYARINGYCARLPPLRARKEDLYRLLQHFLERLGRRDVGVTVPFMVALCHYDWPYNVRELEGVVRRAIALLDAEKGARQLDVRHLPEAIERQMQSYGREAEVAPRGSVSPPSARATAPSLDDLRAVLTRHKGNVAAVARELGKDRVQIHRWMKRHGLSPDDFRT